MHTGQRYSRKSDTESTALTELQSIISSGHQEGSSSVECDAHQSCFCLSEQFICPPSPTCVSSESALADLIKYHERFLKALGVLLVPSASVNKSGYLMAFSCIVSERARPIRCRKEFWPTVQPAGVDCGVRLTC